MEIKKANNKYGELESNKTITKETIKGIKHSLPPT
jgi:hypothetical protein